MLSVRPLLPFDYVIFMLQRCFVAGDWMLLFGFDSYSYVLYSCLHHIWLHHSWLHHSPSVMLC